MLLLDYESDRSPPFSLGYGVFGGRPHRQSNLGRCQGEEILSTST